MSMSERVPAAPDDIRSRLTQVAINDPNWAIVVRQRNSTGNMGITLEYTPGTESGAKSNSDAALRWQIAGNVSESAIQSLPEMAEYIGGLLSDIEFRPAA
jgi:hypothetical protein